MVVGTAAAATAGGGGGGHCYIIQLRLPNGFIVHIFAVCCRFSLLWLQATTRTYMHMIVRAYLEDTGVGGKLVTLNNSPMYGRQ